MIRVGVGTKAPRRVELAEGVDRAIEDAMDRGYYVSQRRAAETSDEGTLLKSGYPPRKESDGSWAWGYTARHAEPIETGTRPHWIPMSAMDRLKGWARRTLGDEDAAWAVRAKIAKEGTKPQPYVRPGYEAMVDYLRTHGMAKYVRASISYEHKPRR